MTLAPEQELALNMVIFAYALKNNCPSFGVMETPDDYEETPEYTRDLNAIVDVVQRWCEAQTEHNEFALSWYKKQRYWMAAICTVTDDKPLWYTAKKEQPALALCLAFAEAAGLDWEKTNE